MLASELYGVERWSFFGMASYKPVTAALRVLEVLDAVSRLQGNATVGKIFGETGIDKATIVRMLETLIHAHYVARTPGEQNYHITGKTLALSAGFDRGKALGHVVSPLLDDFCHENGWPSLFAIFDQDAMLVVETSLKTGPLSLNSSRGSRLPVLGASVGLAYIAHCSANQRNKFLQEVKDDPEPWNRIARDSSRLQEALAQIRKQGFAEMDATYSSKEYESLVSSIGVPVMVGTNLFGSVNIVYVKTAFTSATARKKLVRPLKVVAEQMAGELAHTFPGLVAQ